MVRFFSQDDADIVTAHKPGFDGQHENVGSRIDIQPQFPGFQVETVVHGRCKGDFAQGGGVELQQDVMHGGVADNADIDNLLGVNLESLF